MEQAELIRSIRNRLRLAMNGVVATSMREKGMHYKLIFGVSLLELREIAEAFREEASVELAEALWKEDVRELKMLATMLCPPDTFAHERAEAWLPTSPIWRLPSNWHVICCGKWQRRTKWQSICFMIGSMPMRGLVHF